MKKRSKLILPNSSSGYKARKLKMQILFVFLSFLSPSTFAGGARGVKSPTENPRPMHKSDPEKEDRKVFASFLFLFSSFVVQRPLSSFLPGQAI